MSLTPVAVWLLLATPIWAQNDLFKIRFVSFPSPGAGFSTNTTLYDINNRGDLVGGFEIDQSGQVVETGTFVLEKSGRIVRLPKIGSTSPSGYSINDAGMVAGEYYDLGQQRSFGFIWSPVSGYTTVACPESRGQGLRGINLFGEVVGTCALQNGSAVAYFRNQAGVCRQIADLARTRFFPRDINDSGTVVGSCEKPIDREHTHTTGCILRGEVLEEFRHPKQRFTGGLSGTTIGGINSFGDQVGTFTTAPGLSAFLRTGTGKLINFTGRSAIIPQGINDSQEFVGNMPDLGAFVATPIAGPIR